MKSIKLFFLFTIMIVLNIVNIVDFDFKNIIFIFIGITLWIISIPNLRETSRTKKILSVIFILLLLIIGYFSVNWKYWYPLQMWWDTSWLYIPIILFIASKIINSNYFIERIENNNKKLIITYIITFIIVLGIITLIEKLTENINMSIILHPYLGIISSILFIYELYNSIDITIDINMLNISIVFIELLFIIILNASQYQKINKYTNSTENIISLINSEKLTYNNINSELDSQIVEYHNNNEVFDNYYKNRTFVFLSIAREWDYSVIISTYKSGINNTKKNNFNSLLNNFKENQNLLDTYIDNNKMYSRFIMVNMLLSIIETILLICFSIRKKHIV